MINPIICPRCFQPNEAARSYCWKCNRSLELRTETADYLRLFNLRPTSSRDELKVAYHRTATKFHPDKNPGDREAEAQFKFVAQAYEALLPMLGQEPSKVTQAAPDQTGPAVRPESAEIIDKEIASFLSRLYSESTGSRGRRLFRRWLVISAGLAAMGDLLYGIHLYRSRSPKVLYWSDLPFSFGVLAGVLAIPVMLIIFADQMPRIDVIPYTSSIVSLDPRIWTFAGWMLLWFLLVIAPVILPFVLGIR
jgi:hypothetical protein